MPDTPILTEVESAMKTLIESMTIDSGDYHFDWESVNELDMAKRELDDGRNAACIIELDPEETNLDDPEGVHAQAYANEVTFKITCWTKFYKETDNPIFSNNAELNKALDDLKKIFGINYTVSGTCDMILYRSSNRVRRLVQDMMIPTKLETYWLVKYTQDRYDPSQLDP